jgi:hypothetical protein
MIVEGSSDKFVDNEESYMRISQLPHEPAPFSKNNPKLFANSFYNSTFAITWDIGVVMIILAVAGVFDSHFLGLHLSFMHCFVLAIFGLLSVWSGVTTKRRSFVINLVAGVFFLMNSVLAFLAGDRGHLKIGYGSNEDMIVKMAPGFLELSTFDHIFHLCLGLFFLLVAYLWKSKSQDFPANLRND